jgi:glucosylceramidase
MAGDRLATKAPIQFETLSSTKVPSFEIHTGNMLQQMTGFGATFSEAGMICLGDLSVSQQESVLQGLFDSDRGAGFSLMKTPIAGGAFMAAGPWYSYDDVPGDIEMKHFSVKRDVEPDGIITFIKRAQHYGNFRLDATMEYPPDWMLVDPATNQSVRPEYYDALARYYLTYVRKYQDEGVFVQDVTLFEEPRQQDQGYTAISYLAIGDLLKNHVAPLFASGGMNVQLIPAAARTAAEAYRSYPAITHDAETRQYLRDLSVEEDTLSSKEVSSDSIAALHRAYPDLRLLMSRDGMRHRAGWAAGESTTQGGFEDGQSWGDIIASDIEAGASGWIYQNTILDENGGPWLMSNPHHAPENNAKEPLVIINRQSRTVRYTGLYYSLAHFSKFVRPGALRVLMDGKYPGLHGLAFLSPDPKGGWRWVVEMINDRPESTPIQIAFELNVIHRAFQITLAASSVTTFVWTPQAGTIGNLPAGYMDVRNATNVWQKKEWK